MIGWLFGNGILAYNGEGGFSVRWLHGFLYSTSADNQIHDFNGSNRDREYSILAVINPVNGKLLSPPNGSKPIQRSQLNGS